MDFVRPGFAPFFSTPHVASRSGTPCPRSSLRKRIQTGLGVQERSACPDSQEIFRRPEAPCWPPPPLLAVLQDAELSLGPTVGGGAERSGNPLPHSFPSSGFCLVTVLLAASDRHRPSYHLPPPSPGHRSPWEKPGTAPRPSSGFRGGGKARAETEKATARAIGREE